MHFVAFIMHFLASLQWKPENAWKMQDFQPLAFSCILTKPDKCMKKAWFVQELYHAFSCVSHAFTCVSHAFSCVLSIVPDYAWETQDFLLQSTIAFSCVSEMPENARKRHDLSKKILAFLMPFLAFLIPFLASCK